MANQEHLDILKQGVEVWNQWILADPNTIIIPDLTGADLSGANLTGPNLTGATLSNATLNKTQLTYATTSQTTFGNVDLRTVKGLETVEHQGPSTIGIDTIYRSHGNIPESFLRGAGVDDRFIENIRSLTQNLFEYYTCFISYSTKDQAFAEQLYANLQSKNVRCWFAPHNMKIGEKIYETIDSSIRIP